MRIKAIDLFCGAGGSSWGAQKAGAKVVAAFDNWIVAAKTHHLNFPEAKLFRGKLENRRVRKLKKQIGRVDLILSSPECTSHSPARGSRPSSDKSKDTAFQVIRFADVFQPRWIVVENVVSMRRWFRYNEFRTKLEELGYFVTEQVLNALDFGVPQSRRRLFLLCDNKQKPDPIKRIRSSRRLNARSFIHLNGKYKWAVLATKRRAKATLERVERAESVVGEKKPFIIVYYGSDHAGGWQKLNAPLRTITTLDRFAVVKTKKRVRVMRMLQVPELQQAMGMQGMRLENGTRRDRIKLIGNAVCPPVMQKVVNSLTNSEKKRGVRKHSQGRQK